MSRPHPLEHRAQADCTQRSTSRSSTDSIWSTRWAQLSSAPWGQRSPQTSLSRSLGRPPRLVASTLFRLAISLSHHEPFGGLLRGACPKDRRLPPPAR